MVNISKTKLTRLNEFKELLSTYKPSKASKQLLSQTKLVLLVGPTAAGRNTLINLLVDTGRYRFIVSDTTRKKRLNNGIMEQNGREYWFRTEDDFLDRLKKGEYIEAAIIHNQQVSGISTAELKKSKDSGKIAIDEITAEGPENIYKHKPDTLFIFLLPPTFEIWIQRLKNRGDLDNDELIRRLQSAIGEIKLALSEDYYHFVINNEIHEAAQAVDELANGRQPDPEKQQKGRDHAEQLSIEVGLYLKNL